MVSKKNNTNSIITKVDRWIIAGGFVSITLLAWYLANILFYGHAIAMLVEVVVYITTLAIYTITLFRPNQSLIIAARTLSFLWITAAFLVAAFVIYFIATFRW